MASFFGAWQSVFPGPLVTKNNRLILLANVVGEALPAARFLCLRREPVGLAISLLEARKVILNDLSKPYGAVGPEYFRDADGCPPELQVCLQVRYYEDAIRRQQQMLGPDRFQVVEYGQFCGHPSMLVQEIGHQLRIEPLAATLSDLKPFRDAGARPGRTTLRPIIERHCRDLGLLHERSERSCAMSRWSSAAIGIVLGLVFLGAAALLLDWHELWKCCRMRAGHGS